MPDVFSSGMRNLFLVALLVLGGCAASPPLQDLPTRSEYLRPQFTFRVSPENKYAVVMSGQIFSLSDGSAGISNAQDLQRQTPIEDEFVNTDVDQITRLLTFKEFDTYQLSFRSRSIGDFYTLLNEIAKVSNPETQLFVCYSGEGDDTGLRTCALRINPSQLIMVPYTTITPADLYMHLTRIKGQSAVLINACQSGVFVEEAPETFDGVVITACNRNSVTTPYEPYNTTTIFAAFFDLYADDPALQLDLHEIELELGDWYHNFMHQMLITPKPGLRVSYEPQIFRPKFGKFLF